jgi:hypothetical protein
VPDGRRRGTSRAVEKRLLATYLNDHLAGATAAAEVASRAAASNRADPRYKTPLAELREEIWQDRQSLLEIMEELDVSVDKAKQLLAWTAEKVGRLKLNGRLRGYSPLSRVVELEFLTLGVTGKIALWRTLAALSPTEPSLDAKRLEDLLARACGQLERLEECRQQAAAEVFR